MNNQAITTLLSTIRNMPDNDSAALAILQSVAEAIALEMASFKDIPEAIEKKATEMYCSAGKLKFTQKELNLMPKNFRKEFEYKVAPPIYIKLRAAKTAGVM